MAAVICGSLAFDTIMNFDGRFADQILPGQPAQRTHPRTFHGAGHHERPGRFVF